jgi:hypothetical protein
MLMRSCIRDVAVAALALTLSAPAAAQTVEASVKNDVSEPLSSVPPPPLKAQAAFKKVHRVKRIPPPAGAQAAAADTAVQKKAAGTLPIGPIGTTEGIGEGLVIGGQSFFVTSFPADTAGAAGSTQYVQWVNTSLLVIDKATQKILLGPVDGSVLWRGFGGNCEHNNDGDPIVLFDRTINRWVLTQFAVSGTPFSQCIAVSRTDDATGAYHRYEFQYQDFNDYGKFGIWPDGYYSSFNMFKGNAFLGAKVCAYEREKMIVGNPARMVCFDVPAQGGLVPSDVDGPTAPPAGSPNFVMNLGSNRLNLWRFQTNWANPGASTFTGPVTIKTAPFQQACPSGPTPGTCVVQPTTTQRLDTLSDRLMYRLAYRNFGTHESLVVTHSVAVTPTRAAVRWYEVRNPNATPMVRQQGTYAPTTTSRWMGSAAMDKMGNLAMGYTASSGSVFPSIRVAGRLVSDAPGTLRTERIIPTATGKGAQRDSDRWGDYSSMTLDPTDDCTFWYTAQYQGAKTSDWHTSIVRFKFSACK